MKKWLILLIPLLLLFPLKRLPVFASPSFEEVNAIQSFKIYYGWSSPEVVEELKNYDLIVIAAHAFSNEDIENLQQAGTKVIGYLSVMQLENWNDEWKKNIVESDYYDHDGERLYIEEWDTYVMDIRQDHYRELLWQKVEDDIKSKQLDGIFFDTVDDLDAYFNEDPETLKQMRESFGKFIKVLRFEYPSWYFIQNRGFDTYKQVSHKWMDIVLWESFRKERLKENDWGQKWLRYFQKQQRKQEIRVWSVVTDKESEQWSKRQLFLPFYTENGRYH